MKRQQAIIWITGILTLLLTVFSFILSFNALNHLAAQNGVSVPALFPLVVEAGVIVFSLNALSRSLRGEPVWWQWCLIIGSSLLAGSFNVAHAPPVFLSRVMAAMPSLFLILSFESFLSLIRSSVERHEQVTSIAQMEEQLSQLTSRVSGKQKQLARLTPDSNGNGTGHITEMNQKRQDTMAQRREQVVSYRELGMSQQEMADELGVSLATIKRDLKAVNGHRAGNGQEVS